MTLARVDDLHIVTFPTYKDERGSLSAAELHSVVKFPILRMFWINAVEPNGRRGGHAHKQCNQFMICLQGEITIEAYDGEQNRLISLSAGCGIHIPPAIYATEQFEKPSSLLAVLCDLPYDKNDYIYEGAELAQFRRQNLHPST